MSQKITSEIVQVDVDKITLDKDNPNVMSDKEMEQLKTSMDIYGFVYPILVDQNFMIIDGEHRYVTYKGGGAKEVPCIILDIKSEAKRKALRQAIHKIRGHHNTEKDLKELQIIIDQDPELLKSLIGFEERDLEDLKKAVNLVPADFKRQPKNKEEYKELELKKMINAEVDEELFEQIRFIMKEEKIKKYEDLLQFFVEIYHR